MRALVTGAAGFVGRRLVPRLEAAGYQVTGVDREVDVADAEAVARIVDESAPDAIVHLAALSFVPDADSAPDSAFRVNFLGTCHLLEAAAQRAPRARVLTISTGNVYGAADLDAPPFDETSPLRPDSPYARSKAAADLLARSYADRSLDVVRARPFNHTGKGRPDSFVESSFARQLVEIELGRSEPRIRVGNLASVRDFLDVEDVVTAYLRLLDRGVPSGAYNVASGTGRSMRELLDGLRALSPIGGDVHVSVEDSRHRPTDRRVGNADRLREAANWKPSIPFERTLAELLEGWRTALQD
jgi:GDP-4-dehydro-6-deoxy-D-mannose reductase